MCTTPSQEVASGLRLTFLAVIVFGHVGGADRGVTLEAPTPARPAIAATTTMPRGSDADPALARHLHAPQLAGFPALPEPAQGAVADRVLDVAPGELGHRHDRRHLQDRPQQVGAVHALRARSGR